MRSLSVALLASLLLAPSVIAGPNYAPGSLDRDFTIEWQTLPGRRGPVLEGFVHNRAHLHADRMRLSITLFDASGRVTGTTTTWVLGGVPPNNRTWFSTPVPPAARYEVEILSFDWIGRGGGAGQ
jgi:hypothetical protein